VTGCGGTLSGSTYTTGAITASCTVTASFKITTYTITATAGTGGTITPSGATTVNSGANQTYTITPGTGYTIAGVTVDGSSAGAVSTYTFSGVTANHTIAATFAQSTYTVTPSAGADGSISPATAQTVTYNGTKAFTVTPNSGYSISSVTGCSGTLSGSTYTTGAITASCTVTATFKDPPTYTITATAGTGGTITPSGATTVNSGANQTYTITPGTGYTIAGVTVDGSSSGAVSTYTFSGVTANHTIAATFAQSTYTVTPSAGANGSMSPATVQTVAYNGSTAFKVTPNSGYSIASVTGCGGTLSGSTYTTGAVTANCTVTATFGSTTYAITATAGTGGTITPSGTTSVNSGANQTFTITPATGYNIAGVTVDGSSAGAVSTYTFSGVTANHTIAATFAEKMYTVTPFVGADGSISPATVQTVAYNGTTAFTVTPNIGYSIASVTGCGGTLSGSTYTTGPISLSCAVSATFALGTGGGSIAINGGAAAINTTSVTLSLSGPSGVSQVCVSNTTTCTAWTAFATTESWTLPTGDGTKTVYAWFKNVSGTVNASPYSAGILLDTTPPTNGTVTATPGNGQVALNWSGFNDAGSGIGGYKIAYAVGSTPSSCSTGTAIYTNGTTYLDTGLSNGKTYGYRVCAIDNAGNMSTGATARARPGD
jgi:hypothetical protein